MPLLPISAVRKVLALSGKRHAASVAIDYRAPAWSQASVIGLVRAPAPLLPRFLTRGYLSSEEVTEGAMALRESVTVP